MTTHQLLLDLTNDLASIIDAPRRCKVSEACREALIFGEGQSWDSDETPYMVEPMDGTYSRHHKELCFVGPARTGKTLSLILGRYVFTILHHPVDMMVVGSTQDLVRDLSQRELERLHELSEQVVAAMTGRLSDNNVYDKTYKSGIRVVLGWPTATQLASRTLIVMLLTDYDRWPGNLGREGSGYLQAKKRTQTGGSAAMTVIESSPGSRWLDPGWTRPAFVLGEPLEHGAPPSESGIRADIMPIYNSGTRCWWYVPCQACGEYYPQWADLSVFSWSPLEDITEASRTAGTVCCWCAAVHGEQTKRTENLNGVWLAQGEVIDCWGKITGTSLRNRTYPSYWLGGGAAAYQSRAEIVLKWLQACRVYEEKGDDIDQQTVINQDVGASFRALPVGDLRTPHPLYERREDRLGELVIPLGVRFIVAAVDIQKNRFVVQVIGYGTGRQRWVIDYYNIRKSNRRDKDGNTLDVSPSGYGEDWELLDKLITKSYPLSDKSGRRMRMMCTLCDSGGHENVTLNAFNYYRSFTMDKSRPERAPLRNKFRLLKGASSMEAALLAVSYPISKRQKRATRGDVPQLNINTHVFKDMIARDLNRDTPGPGYTRFPAWLPMWWYEELTREQRTEKGWTAAKRNEAFDLMVYCDAGAMWGPLHVLRKVPKGMGVIDWNRPPGWAAAWPDNVNVFHPDQAERDGQDRGAGRFAF